MDLSGLNNEQVMAVKHINGPMLVLAGAGSGKTRVLTNRIAYLIENGIDTGNILAITFTNKAAKEMKERVFKLIGSDANNIQISTFHSLGLRIIRENYSKLGYKSNFNILDSDDSLVIIKKIIKELNLNPKYYNAREIKNKISSAKNELMSVEKFSSVEFDKEIINIYDKYNKKLLINNSVDFDDLLILPIKLFKNYPDVLLYYQNKFKYVLIDEYQDTNEAQYTFSKMLCNNHRNIFVVGDNDQAIYAFRGANYKNILNFEKDYPDCKTILLEENYRSTKNILDAANSVIKHNKFRKDKNLRSNNGIGTKVCYVRVDTDKDECSFISDMIKKLHSDGEKYEEIAVLYRTNAQSRLIEEEMLKNGIPYKIVGSFYFYNRSEIKNLLCYLRLINNSDDDVSLLRVINTPKRGIGEKSIETLAENASKLGCSLYNSISSGKELKFKELIESLKNKCEKATLTEMVDIVLNDSGLKQELMMDKSLENEIRLENLEEFKSITRNYEEEYGVISLGDFLNEISLVSDMSEHQDGNNKVNLMTIHSVKGLEYDNVFIIGMEEGLFPHYNSINEGSLSAIEEERRLCYVAITRAKKNLWMLNAKKRILFGNNQNNEPSRFMDEIDSLYMDVLDNRSTFLNRISSFNIKDRANSFNKKDHFNNNHGTFKIGDHVNHDIYGEGIVISIDNSILTIAFPHPYGIKKILENHKSIKKI